MYIYHCISLYLLKLERHISTNSVDFYKNDFVNISYQVISYLYVVLAFNIFYLKAKQKTKNSDLDLYK